MQITSLNTAIAGGNALCKTVHDLLMAAEYVDVTDPATIQMVRLLSAPEGGPVLTADDVARILGGEKHG